MREEGVEHQVFIVGFTGHVGVGAVEFFFGQAELAEVSDVFFLFVATGVDDGVGTVDGLECLFERELAGLGEEEGQALV